MTAEAATEPAGPLDAVFACPGCGCLVVDQDLHNTACARRPGEAAPPLGPQIIEWLDSLDPTEIEQAAYSGASLDAEPTAALLAELRRQAADL